MDNPIYTPLYFVTSPEAHVMLVTPTTPPLTLANLQAELTGYQQATQPICDRLNKCAERLGMTRLSYGYRMPL